MRNQIKSRMAEILKIPAQNLNEDTKLTDLVQDSFVLIEMIIELQEEFQFRVNQEDLAQVQSCKQLLDVIEAKLP